MCNFLERFRMGKPGGADRWGFGPRRGSAMMLAAALLAVGSPAQASTTPADQGAPVDASQGVPAQAAVPAPPAPAPPVDVAPAPVDPGTAQPAAPPPNNGLYVV